MTTTDNITWTGYITPADDVTGAYSARSSQGESYTLIFSVNPANYNDFKGNPGYERVDSAIVVDTKPPLVEHVRVKDAHNIGSGGSSSLLCGGNQLACGTEYGGYNEGASFTKTDGTYRCVPVDSDIQVIFDYKMDPTFVTADESTFCGATVQVSSDNFASCVEMEEDPAASTHDRIEYKNFTLEPAENLSYFTTYKVRVTSDGSVFPKDALENQMTSQYTHATEFRTSAFPSSTPTSGVFVAVGQYGSSFRSIDNGTSWDNETCSFIDNDFNGVTYANNTFIAAGKNSRILKSTNNASSWEVYNAGTNYQFNGIAFGGSTFNVVGASGYTYRSTNNGSSWSRVSPPSTNLQNGPNGYSYYYNRNLYGVSFGNNTFVAVGDVGKIVRSTDNGANWSNVTTGRTGSSGYSYYLGSLYGTGTLRGVGFGNGTFVAVGDSGKILTSTNNGSSWDNETAVNSNNLYGVSFGNSTFVAVGQNGTILRSTNNGASWSNSSPGGNTLWAVTFGNNIFMAVGTGGRIVKSTDNGSNWSSSTSGTINNLYGVTFGD